MTQVQTGFELAIRLSSLNKPMPQLGGKDWLSENEEKGQTFEEYLAVEPVQKNDELITIYICSLGAFSPGQFGVIDLCKEYLELFCDAPTKPSRQENDAGIIEHIS